MYFIVVYITIYIHIYINLQFKLQYLHRKKSTCKETANLLYMCVCMYNFKINLKLTEKYSCIDLLIFHKV